MQDLGFDLRREAQLNTLTEDVVRSSEIEGEKLDSDQVRTSTARRLGHGCWRASAGEKCVSNPAYSLSIDLKVITH